MSSTINRVHFKNQFINILVVGCPHTNTLKSSQLRIVMKLFGTAGIRGPLSKVSPELVQKVGFSVATYFGNEGKIIVGRDARVTGPMLKSSLVSGLLAAGMDVIDGDMVPTPALSFGSYNYFVNGGIMLTASHNPAPDNGIKLFTSDGHEFEQFQEEEIESLVADNSFNLANWDEVGSYHKLDTVIPDYKEHVTNFVELNRELKVVLDCANGAGSLIAPDLMRQLGCKVITVNSQLDGYFPGHPAEPTPENIAETCRVVRSVEADIGFALDGDADRVAIITDRGSIVQDDMFIALCARMALQENGGGTVVTAINTSKCIDDVVKENGGTIERVRLGALHEGIKAHNAVLGGEPWKLIFPEFGLWIDGMFASVKMLQMLSEQNSFKELLSGIPSYPIIRKNFYCTDVGHQQRVINEIFEKLPEVFDNYENILDIDGLRLNMEDGWILVRASGTEPKIRLVCEATSQTKLDEYFKEALHLVETTLAENK